MLSHVESRLCAYPLLYTSVHLLCITEHHFGQWITKTPWKPCDYDFITHQEKMKLDIAIDIVPDEPKASFM